eukprot:m.60947 g.60947  ORF g.60947 m.60947 type:complete len:406 (+) comp7054_c1_seq1:40-1257(+)
MSDRGFTRALAALDAPAAVAALEAGCVVPAGLVWNFHAELVNGDCSMKFETKGAAPLHVAALMAMARSSLELDKKYDDEDCADEFKEPTETIRLVSQLLQAEADVHRPAALISCAWKDSHKTYWGIEGASPLACAIIAGLPACIRALLAGGARLGDNVATIRLGDPWGPPAMRGIPPLVLAMMWKSNMVRSNIVGDRYECADVFELLLQSGADPNSCIADYGTYGMAITPLHMLAWLSARPKLGATFTADSEQDEQREHMGASRMRQLLLAGAQVDRRAASIVYLSDGAEWPGLERELGNATPLHCACAHSRGDLTKVLVEYGADVNATTRDRETPLMLALWPMQQLYGVRVGPETTPCVTALLEAGAQRRRRDLLGWTALHYAAIGGYVPHAELLLAGRTITAK